jgi:hypothetical protein
VSSGPPLAIRPQSRHSSSRHKHRQGDSLAISFDRIGPICRIPEALPRRSLRDLVAETGYRDLRPTLSREEIAGYLAKHPGLVLEWLRYSEDKRTSGGWYLLHPSTGWLVGRLAGPDEEREFRFGSGPEACAEFILRELDGVAGDPVGTQWSG